MNVEPMTDPNKILIITGCTQTKLRSEAKALDIYQGPLFKKVRKFIKYKGIELKILSAKHGLIEKNLLIKPYNKYIKTNKDIEEIQEEVLEKFNKIEKNYDIIILIMGKKYREVFKPVFNHSKLKMIHDPRGIGGMISKMNEYIQKPLSAMLKDLKDCQ